MEPEQDKTDPSNAGLMSLFFMLFWLFLFLLMLELKLSLQLNPLASQVKLDGADIPEILPRHLLPPGKRSGAGVFD